MAMGCLSPLHLIRCEAPSDCNEKKHRNHKRIEQIELPQRGQLWWFNYQKEIQMEKALRILTDEEIEAMPDAAMREAAFALSLRSGTKSGAIEQHSNCSAILIAEQNSFMVAMITLVVIMTLANLSMTLRSQTLAIPF
jgi:hypothetical protein